MQEEEIHCELVSEQQQTDEMRTLLEDIVLAERSLAKLENQKTWITEFTEETVAALANADEQVEEAVKALW